MLPVISREIQRSIYLAKAAQKGHKNTIAAFEIFLSLPFIPAQKVVKNGQWIPKTYIDFNTKRPSEHRTSSVPYGRIYFCHSRPFGVITTTEMKKRKSTVFQNFVCEKKYRESKDIEIDRK